MSAENDKKVRGGKRSGTLRAPIPNDAGVVTTGLGGGQPTKREFKGSQMKRYTFTRIINGIPFTKTISARNIDDANKQAEILGFKTSDRKVKHRKKRNR